MQETKYFAKLIVDNMQLIGKITDSDYVRWKEKYLPITLWDGRCLVLMQAQGAPQTPENPMGIVYQLKITPLYPEQIRQEEVMLLPQLIEIIGKVEMDVQNMEFCSGDKGGLFLDYNRALTNWRAEAAGIVPPQGKMPNNISQFPRRSR